MGKDKLHDKETHGRSDDIDEMTPIDKVKGPDVFHRAKEEVEALVDVFRSKRGLDNNQAAKEDDKEKTSDLEHSDSKVTESHAHQAEICKESHGMNSDIVESTPIDEVKAPSLLSRAKEEVQAVIHSINSKKEAKKQPEETKRIGFWEFLGGILEKCCSPSSTKLD